MNDADAASSHQPSHPRVLLHVGMHKTGSTALQVAFVQNRSLLEDHGWAYPPESTNPGAEATAAQGGVVSGNSSGLRAYLSPGEPDLGSPPPVPPTLLAPVAENAEGRSVLLSSEWLHEFRPGRLRTFVAACRELGFRVEAVGYVRDVSAHAASLHAQQVKRGRLTASFSEYLHPNAETAYRPRLRQWIESLHEILGRDATTVLHYDSLGPDVVAHFFSTQLGITAPPKQPPAHTRVNRSLTSTEVRLMQEVNRQVTRGTAGRLISDVLVAIPPTTEHRPHLTTQDQALLEERFTEEVAWVNTNGLVGGPMQITAPAVPVVEEVPEEQELTPGEHTLASVVAGLADQLAVERRRQSRRRARAAARRAAAQTRAAARETAPVEPKPHLLARPLSSVRRRRKA